MSDDLSAALVEEQLQRAVATALRDEEDDVRDLYGAVGVAALMGDPPPAPPPPQQPQQPAAPAADVHVANFLIGPSCLSFEHTHLKEAL